MDMLNWIKIELWKIGFLKQSECPLCDEGQVRSVAMAQILRENGK